MENSEKKYLRDDSYKTLCKHCKSVYYSPFLYLSRPPQTLCKKCKKFNVYIYPWYRKVSKYCNTNCVIS